MLIKTERSNLSNTKDRVWPHFQTPNKLYTSLSANTIMAKLTNHVQRIRLTTSSTDKNYSLDSEDDFRSGGRNVSHQQQFFSELPSPGRSYYTNYWYSWVQTIYYFTKKRVENTTQRTSRCLGMWSNTVLSVWFILSTKTKTKEKLDLN